VIRITVTQASQLISSHSPGSGIYEILSMIDYLQPELAHIDSTAGHLLQMCKAELLQKLAMEAMTSALRNGPAQINADFASLSQAYGSDATRKITMAQTSRDNKLRSRDTLTKHGLIFRQME
jgi:hypothetical protein